MELYNAKEQLNLVDFLLSNFKTETNDYINYSVSGLKNLREAITILEKNKLYKSRIDILKKMDWFEKVSDKETLNSSNNSRINSFVVFVKNSIEGTLDFLKIINTDKHKYQLNICLPRTYTFSDLEKLSNDLKKCIELPSIDAGGNAKIISAQPGSIWLVIALATSASITIIGKIVKIATQANIEIQKGKIFANYAENLKLNNEIQKTIIEAQKKVVDEIIDKEIEEAKKNIDLKDDITKVNRLKLAVTKMAELLRKDIKFLPSPKLDPNLKSEFPESNEIDQISEELKKLGQSNNEL